MSQMSNGSNVKRVKCQMSTNVKWVQMSNEYKFQTNQMSNFSNVKLFKCQIFKCQTSQMSNESNVKWVQMANECKWQMSTNV